MINRCYEQALNTGRCHRPAGLRGKYDNVRRFWEDGITGIFLAPYLENIKKKIYSRGSGLRVLDLGCGSGDGYKLLTELKNPAGSQYVNDNKIFSENEIELYTGIDINPALLEQGKDYYGENNKLTFIEGDFSGGIPLAEEQKSFDIYLGTYGTFSHCDDKSSVNLLSDIAGNAPAGALVMADWLGWQSYEWQDLWKKGALEKDLMMDYVISYLSNGKEEDVKPEPFQLRLMNKETLISIVNKASLHASRKIKILNIFDRSVFVGRHMETGEYNNNPLPVRQAVNSLFERDRITSLNELLIDYYPKSDFKKANSYFVNTAGCWNKLVEYTGNLVEGRSVFPPQGLPVLQKSAQVMQKLTGAVKDIDLENVRAEIIEPQLAYCLRNIEMTLQGGEGRAHSIATVLQIQ